MKEILEVSKEYWVEKFDQRETREIQEVEEEKENIKENIKMEKLEKAWSK